MTVLFQDTRCALRLLRRSPAFTVTLILTLGLGIGANVAIFALVSNLLMQPLPFSQPERLVRVFDDLRSAGVRDVGMSVPELIDLQQQSTVFQGISPAWPINAAVTGGDGPERIEVLSTTPNYFQILGVKAALGRLYSQSEWVPGYLNGVVISDGLWRRQFAADSHVVGRLIRLDGDTYTVIGVLPSAFRHPGRLLDGDVDVWAAAGFVGAPAPSPPVRSLRLFPAAIGRLRPGIELTTAQQRLNAMAAQISRRYPKEYPAESGWSLRLEPLQETVTGNVRPTLIVLAAAVFTVLLMLCVNIASLLMARSSARVREFAIRRALGASRARLVRQLLTESLLLSLTSGAAAVLVLLLTRASLLALLPSDLLRLSEMKLNWSFALVAFLFSLITGALFGLTPALQGSAANPNVDLKDGGRTGASQGVARHRFRKLLVISEIGLSTVLLIGAGLLTRSFASMLQESPGFNPARLTIAQVWLPAPNDPRLNRYANPPQRIALASELLAQFSALPGVEQAAVGTSANIPVLNDERNPTAFAFSGETATTKSQYAAEFGSVSPDYFKVMRIPLQAGRVFTRADSEKSPTVVLVNEAFARQFSPGRNVIGRRFEDSQGNKTQIIGIVGNVRNEGLDQVALPRVYKSVFQDPGFSLALFIRTRSDSKLAPQLITGTVRALDSELPVFGVHPMQELLLSSLARRRFSLTLMSFFAGLALLLAAIGIYGLMTFTASQRVQEFGVRLALGAQLRDILLLTFRPGLLLAFFGILTGLVVSAGLMRLLSSLLFNISSSDPLTFGAVPLLVGLVTVAACWLPAWRAARISPAVVIRN